MGSKEQTKCPENEELVEYMLKWWNGLSEKRRSPNMESNINRAFASVCHHKFPITTPREFLALKHVGKWMVREMRGFFKNDVAEDGNSPSKGKKTRGTRKYLPQKNSAAYALLIALYRGEENGIEHMRKQELIDEAEASGLSRGPIGAERGKGKPGHIGSSSKEYYTGWSAMRKLIDKALVIKSSCPAKYKLSDEGRRIAVECLSQSGTLESAQNSVNGDECSDSDKQDAENVTLVPADSPKEKTSTTADVNKKNGSRDDISAEYLAKFTRLGYTREQVLHVWNEVSASSPKQEMSMLWLTVLCRLREDEVYGIQAVPRSTTGSGSGDTSKGQQYLTPGPDSGGEIYTKSPVNSETCSTSLRCENQVHKTLQSGSGASQNVLRMPPLKPLEKFGDVYKVVLVLDDREHFIRSKSRNIVQTTSRQFGIEIEKKRLPVGDGIWIARHKQYHTEYVLDFIVERKNVDDLRSSIRDNRYKDQKLRLLRTGIKKIIYLVEGDPNACDGADSIKTACFTTEILEGFDVQRTNGLGDTLNRYGYLTLAITDQYQLNSSLADNKSDDCCPEYNQFLKRCNDIDKLTISDVFATQLMQVPQVTEEVAVAVLDCYPTLYSLVKAYTDKNGDPRAQAELLVTKSNGVISPNVSKRIFEFIWTT